MKKRKNCGTGGSRRIKRSKTMRGRRRVSEQTDRNTLKFKNEREERDQTIQKGKWRKEMTSEILPSLHLGRQGGRDKDNNKLTSLSITRKNKRYRKQREDKEKENRVQANNNTAKNEATRRRSRFNRYYYDDNTAHLQLLGFLCKLWKMMKYYPLPDKSRCSLLKKNAVRFLKDCKMKTLRQNWHTITPFVIGQTQFRSYDMANWSMYFVI